MGERCAHEVGFAISRQQNFFSANLLGRILFFLLICLQDFCSLKRVSPSPFLLDALFSSDKPLQEFFFQNHPPPAPPSKVRWSAPERASMKVVHGQFQQSKEKNI